MPNRLSAAAVEQYRRDGLYFPIRVFPADDARECRRQLEAFEATQQRGPLGGELRHKPHLIFTWLDAVEDVIGPNILLWRSSFVIKEPRDAAYVSGHQDATYWGLSTGIERFK